MIENTNLPVTEKSALLVESANFESRKFHRIDDDTLRIKPTITSRAFSLLFVVLGLILIGLYAFNTFTAFDGPGSIPLMLIGVMFSAAGLASYYSSNTQLVVNRQIGVAFVQSWRLSVPLDTRFVKRQVGVQDIIGIQTVSRVVKHRSNRNTRLSSYTEYQVNLCTSNTERQNLFITLKSEKADELANQLIDIFNVPLRSS